MSGTTTTRRCGSRRRPAVVGDNGNGYVETDPTGRYGRFDELLGKGAMKSVYRGFDEERGVEVAWNQASLCDVFRTPDALQRMYSEVQLLSKLRHDAIIVFHASWVDVPRRTFNFITELFSSGTLRSYRLRYPRVGLRAVRSWARQILRGLAYLHAHDPPVIHRDLKCDNLLVNGHLGQVKIGDLGLAAVLRGAGQAAHSVIGTPEFMAPEMYDEEYNELVDVYSFGMCMLEMLTVEFPYSECSNPAQIYKKVTAGKLPDAFYRVKDHDAQRFIGRCLVAASSRPSAAELLQDPFLLDDPPQTMTSPRRHPTTLPPFTTSCHDAAASDNDDHHHHQAAEVERAEPTRSDMTITGKLNAEEDTIFLKVQIADDDTGHVRNIYFPFDVASDTAIEVAREMVKELDIKDRDPSEIAAMIEQEIHRLLPGRAQHEYSYDDDDENEEQPPPPFYYLSSSPTSSCSGTGTFFSADRRHGGGSCWSKDHYCCYPSSDDDDMSSMHSGKYPAQHCDDTPDQVHQEEADEQGPEEEEKMTHGPISSSSSKATRFGPSGDIRSPSRTRTEQQDSSSSATTNPPPRAHQLHGRQQCSTLLSPEHAGRRPRNDDEDRRHRRMMSRNRSMVDMRSQLLHRTLVEELNRRLFFNTVGAVENIGFRAPHGYGPSSSTRGRGRVVERGRRSREDRNNNDRYCML